MSSVNSVEAQEEVAPVEDPALEVLSNHNTLAMSAKLSAMLFSTTKPMTAADLAKALDVKVERVEAGLEEARQNFFPEIHGFSLEEIAGGWQFRTVPAAAASVRRLIPNSAKKLSKAAAETLAVIAYKQPVQRAEVEAIRGVDCLATLKTLLDAKLVRIVGRENTAGQPALYGTTKAFLEKFGLEDLSQLPTPREAMQLASEEGEVEDLEDDSEVATEDSEAEGSETEDFTEEEVVESPVEDSTEVREDPAV